LQSNGRYTRQPAFGQVAVVRILAICGSLKKGSSNHALIERVIALPPDGVAIVAYEGLRDLPHFDPDLELDGALPAVDALRAAVSSCDAVVIASPEYGHSLPGVLKNAIDWLIGTGELEGKIVAITAAVPHPERGRLGLRALGDTLAAVSARVVWREPIVRGPGLDRGAEGLLAAVIAEVARGGHD
jgi:chromate reductase